MLDAFRFGPTSLGRATRSGNFLAPVSPFHLCVGNELIENTFADLPFDAIVVADS